MTHKVKCIYIDSQAREVRFEYRELPVREKNWKCAGFEKGRLLDADHVSKRKHFHSLLHYRNPVDDAYEIPRTGFFWRDNFSPDKAAEPFDRSVDNYKLICGDALIVCYEGTIRKSSEEAIPVDTYYSLEEIRQYVGEWNRGIIERLPDFTCILNESFAEKGYELLLRIENEGDLYGQHAEELTKPIRMLTPQIVNFEFQYDEVTIVTGFIDDLNRNTRVTIFESGTAKLRTIAECTLSAAKIPKWVEARLQEFFFEKVVVTRFNRKLSHMQPRLTAVQNQANL